MSDVEILMKCVSEGGCNLQRERERERVAIRTSIRTSMSRADA